MTHDYSGHEEPVSPDQLKQLNSLADKLDDVNTEIETREAEIKALGEQRRQLRETDIPELMQSVGMKALTTTGGLEVTLREEVRASFPKDLVKREEAFSWLRANNHDGLIKQSFVISFTREQEAAADKFQRDLARRKSPLNIERKKDLNHQTMLAFLKEQRRDGVDVPLNLFGAFVQKFADLKRPKK